MLDTEKMQFNSLLAGGKMTIPFLVVRFCAKELI